MQVLKVAENLCTHPLKYFCGKVSTLCKTWKYSKSIFEVLSFLDGTFIVSREETVPALTPSGDHGFQGGEVLWVSVTGFLSLGEP